MPYLNSAQAAHPAYSQSLELLREMGVLIGSYEPTSGRPAVARTSTAEKRRWNCLLPSCPHRPDQRRRAGGACGGGGAATG